MARRKIDIDVVVIENEVYIALGEIGIITLTPEEAEELSIALAECITRPPTLQHYAPE